MLEVLLSPLGVPLRISTDRREMADLIAELWAPFVTRHVYEEAIDLAVVESGPNWVIQAPDGTSEFNDPWSAVLFLRTVIDSTTSERALGIAQLHAVALAREGHALLLPGAAGSGKTSLAVELTERGWALLCDDFTPIDLETRKVLPYHRPIGLRARSRSAEAVAGRWTEPRWLRSLDGAPRLLPADKLPLAKTPTTVTGIVFPSFAATTRFAKLRAAEAAARCASFMTDAGPHGLALFAHMTRSAVAAEVAFEEPSEAADALEAWFH